jgi:hypothetical protein
MSGRSTSEVDGSPAKVNYKNGRNFGLTTQEDWGQLEVRSIASICTAPKKTPKPLGTLGVGGRAKQKRLDDSLKWIESL